MATVQNHNQIDDVIENLRYSNMLESLTPLTSLFEGKNCLDFGCSWGTSGRALIHLGAAHVVGVEPDFDRVVGGKQKVLEWGLEHLIDLRHAEDTSKLPFESESFEYVHAQAVFEHIPQPRTDHLREVWRVIAPGGYLVIAETPNKYYPKDDHTTHLWFNHWLPEKLARLRAFYFGKGVQDYRDKKIWPYSGWRGLGYYEMVEPLLNHHLIPETSRSRHRLLTKLGLPASLMDPYPVWVLQKTI